MPVGGTRTIYAGCSMSKQLLAFEQPFFELDEKIDQLKHSQPLNSPTFAALEELERVAHNLQQLRFASLSPWEQFCLARHPQRPYSLDYIDALFTDFVELKGDRLFGEDPAIIAGIGILEGQSMVVLAHQKGRSTKENIYRHFGMTKPEGYRKGQRLMQLADQFTLPLLTLIDTPGAYPGIDAEERGQSQAIASSMECMLGLQVPTISVVIGEGGSGGALAIGASDRILMLEHAIYSVISPRGCAAILWKDSQAEQRAAEQLHMTAKNWQELKICDAIIPEPIGGAHRDFTTTAKAVKDTILEHLQQLQAMPTALRLQNRYDKFRCIGSIDVV